MEHTLILNRWGKANPITFSVHKYATNGNLCISMYTNADGFPEPWSTLTVNLGVKCKENCAFIDINNNGYEILDWLVDNNLGRVLPREKISGFCIYPEFEFDMEAIAKYN